jgi:hypothetical protein
MCKVFSLERIFWRTNEDKNVVTLSLYVIYLGEELFNLSNEQALAGLRVLQGQKFV